MQTKTLSPQQAGTPTASYARLIARRAQAHKQQRPVLPVAVRARLLQFGAEMDDRRDAIVLYFNIDDWERLPLDRRRYVLQALTRYRSVLAVIGSAAVRRDVAGSTHQPPRAGPDATARCASRGKTAFATLAERARRAERSTTTAILALREPKRSQASRETAGEIQVTSQECRP